ncbi:MAG: 7-cyano-7-deazaguanine synthase [Methylobacteriaceae bacterium]|nr:7-cyano-7-deazaguanine synthase [Methylobacteriaceae bacterium]
MPTETDAGALVLFSGGQDSTTCLAWALAHYAHVETIGFDYGQRHAVELKQRPVIREKLTQLHRRWRERLGEDHVIDLRVLGKMSDTAMTRDVEITTSEKGLPSTFVPGRNIMFLTFAAALAYRRGLKRIVGGMCETDFSGYPDCRDDTIKALQIALNLGTESRFVIETPLMWLDKAATWALAHELGGEALVGVIIEDTHTCYLGERGQRHEWGYGCGTCPACELRVRGWREWRSAAPSTQPQTSTSN